MAYICGKLEAKSNGGGHLTLVKTGKNGRHKGITMVYVPADTPGIEMYKIDNMGKMGISTCKIRYNNVEVPEENIVGEINRGFYYAMDGFNYARILVKTACNGLSEAILDRGLEYIKQRKAFGKSLGKFQGVSFKFSELKMELEMSKLLTYKAAYLAETDSNDLHKFSAMSKYKAPQVALHVVKNVMMWFVEYSYSKEAGKKVPGAYLVIWLVQGVH